MCRRRRVWKIGDYMEPIYDIAFGGLDEHGESIISAEEEERNEQVMYGDLVLSIAPKVRLIHNTFSRQIAQLTF